MALRQDLGKYACSPWYGLSHPSEAGVLVAGIVYQTGPSAVIVASIDLNHVKDQYYYVARAARWCGDIPEPLLWLRVPDPRAGKVSG